jgi:hypothetical protein
VTPWYVGISRFIRFGQVLCRGARIAFVQGKFCTATGWIVCADLGRSRPAPGAEGVRVRVLITTAPGLGHLNPLVPLARGLVAAGHEVLVASPAGLRQAVEDAGLPFAAIGTTQIPDGLIERVRDDGGDWRRRQRNALTIWWVEYRARHRARRPAADRRLVARPARA